MARSIIHNDVFSGETSLPDQIFVFGGFSLHANSIGHLEKINNYAPVYQISFGNLNYVADIRGDLIFEGFAVTTTALALDLEHITRSEDGSLEPAGPSATMELATEDPGGTASPAGLETHQVCPVIGKPYSPPDTSPELSRPASSELARRLPPRLAPRTLVSPSKPRS